VKNKLLWKNNECFSGREAEKLLLGHKYSKKSAQATKNINY
jgi:hypothetical protein